MCNDIKGDLLQDLARANRILEFLKKSQISRVLSIKSMKFNCAILIFSVYILWTKSLYIYFSASRLYTFRLNPQFKPDSLPFILSFQPSCGEFIHFHPNSSPISLLDFGFALILLGQVASS